MGRRIHVLIIEDSQDDVELFVRVLKKGGFEPIFEQVDSRQTLQAALDKGGWDLILSDYSMPHFNGLDALRQVKECQPDIPFLIVSGAIGEETAVQAMKAGAQDYLMKGNLARLIPAIDRELQEAELKRERQKTKEALAKAQERFRGMFESCRDGIAFADLEGRIFDSNDSFTRLTGYRKEELLTMTYADLMPSSHRNLQLQFGHEIFKTGESTEFEREYLKKNGERIPVLLTLFVVHGMDGGTPSLAVFAKDISERKRLETMKDALISTVSHEMRTPLTVIKGSLENLKIGILGPLKKKQLCVIETVSENIERLARIVSNTLDLARLESGWTVLSRQSVTLKPMICEVVESFRQVIEDRRIRVAVECSELIVLEADPVLLRQLLSQLIDNALRFASSSVTVSALQTTAGIEVSVADDGPGIAVEDQQRLFQKFEQIHRPEGGEGYQGTGLGLVICKKVVEQHGGRLWVESSAVGGTRFFFTLESTPNVSS